VTGCYLGHSGTGAFGEVIVPCRPSKPPAEIVWVEQGEVEPVGEESARQRRPGQEGNGVVGAPVEDIVVLGCSVEQRILVLDDGDRPDSQGPVHQFDRVVR
jgi:hypothetical protein